MLCASAYQGSSYFSQCTDVVVTASGTAHYTATVAVDDPQPTDRMNLYLVGSDVAAPQATCTVDNLSLTGVTAHRDG